VLPLPVVTPISEIKKQLKKNNQALSFYTNNDDMSIGAVYANGAQDISDSVLGVHAHLNF
jgi:glycolate oxidase FAD binding subunit